MAIFGRLKALFAHNDETVKLTQHEREALARENAEATGMPQSFETSEDSVYQQQKLANNGATGSMVGAQYSSELNRVAEAAKASEVINQQRARSDSN
ncbi:MAG: hypothetical protein ACKOWJ_04245 [Micrococcales bacterium]